MYEWLSSVFYSTRTASISIRAIANFLDMGFHIETPVPPMVCCPFWQDRFHPSIPPYCTSSHTHVGRICVVCSIWGYVCFGIKSSSNPIIILLVTLSLWDGGILTYWEVSCTLLDSRWIRPVKRQTFSSHRRWCRGRDHTCIRATTTDMNQTSIPIIPCTNKMDKYRPY